MNHAKRGSWDERTRDTADLSAAYERHRIALFNYFRRCGVAREASEDLTQGVFVVLLERLDRFDRRRGTLRVYLFGIARNLRRSWARRRRPDVSLEGESVASLRAGADGESVVLLRQAVTALPDEQREALILREFHGLTYAEIATVQEVEIGTVRSRLARARQGLRSRLGDASAKNDEESTR